MSATTVMGWGLLPEPRGFVNRVDEVRELLAAIDRTRAEGVQGVFVLTGLPGVGKTVLVAHIAHLIKKTFEHGSLCVRMGVSADADSVDAALAVFLTQLGFDKVPSTRPALRATFQKATADRELLVLVDDVESAAQLTNLLPASARSVVLATSRRRSEGFARARYRAIEVPVFHPDSAVEMVRADIGETRPDADEREIRELADLCGHLPLALNIASAHLVARHRGPIADYLLRLRRAESMLAEFTIDGERPVEAVFEISYQDLKEQERRAYRLLSLHPGNEFGLAAAVALLGPEADLLLESLVAASLLTPVGQDRYELHSLARDHATGLCGQHEHPADCADAVARLGESYLRFAVAREQVFSDRSHFGPSFDGRVPPAYAGDDAWAKAAVDFERERANLRRMVRLAVDERLDQVAWQLAEAMVTYLFQRDLFDDAIEVFTAGLVAAGRIHGDPRPLFRMHAELGSAYFSARDNKNALVHFDQAASLADLLPDESESALTKSKMLVWKAFVHQRLGAAAEAMTAIEQSRALVEGPRFPEHMRAREIALLDMNGSLMLSAVGRHDEAIAAGERAKAYFNGGKEKHNFAKSVANLGESLAHAGARPRAIETLRDAVNLLAEAGIESWVEHSSKLLKDLDG